ncbi:hypothetical protein [Halorussus amylolyticus]|uniref:hypothetical protein n=1 Tax=Halorussus amylolyticus TaxID=1126242 RepID=UPI00138F6591|nr:hypothetical protein [Halorussus amylolyticus]
MRAQSRVLQAIGLLAFVVGFAGYTVFGWRFGGNADSAVTFALAVGAVALAILTLRNR